MRAKVKRRKSEKGREKKWRSPAQGRACGTHLDAPFSILTSVNTRMPPYNCVLRTHGYCPV